MSDPTPQIERAGTLACRFIPLVVILVAAGLMYVAVGDRALSLEALVRHRMTIDAFVAAHRTVAVVVFIAIYILAVTLSVPGSWFLTVTGGFLFGVPLGAAAAVVGATIGATFVFLIARTALAEPLLRRAGSRITLIAKGFRDDAFSYLLFLRLVPAFPFFLVNLVSAVAGVRLSPFVGATALGIVPAAIVYTFAGTGLDAIIAAQQATYRICVDGGGVDCRMNFSPQDVLTPHLLCALVGLAVLALVPVVVHRISDRRKTAK
ncbi:MAG TPA: VTT domain-containing protein [Pseudolabrys sp.]|jgi:uncharacterized membrane protein YdjX (TVP38/TMEM64 family)|nr:VTT domain-containing protein [Pseudolabrys sp.]